MESEKIVYRPKPRRASKIAVVCVEGVALNRKENPMTCSNGAILYRGPSLIDGKPIVAIVTGLVKPTNNSKTGDMLQVWILRDYISPLRAVDIGGDYSICGDCALRGNKRKRIKRICYVSLKNAPLQVWRAYKRGNYQPVDLSTLYRRCRAIRLGAYGDPAAVPTYVWQMLLTGASTWTGYTHAWRTCDQSLKSIIMASVDSDDERVVADALGWRTFRVRTIADTLDTDEVTCPASAEAGHRTTCNRCSLCKGTSNPARSIAIVAHGVGASNFVTLNSLRSSHGS